MKHIIKTALLFVFIILSGNVFGQERLGKNYDEVINTLKADNRKYDIEKLEDGRVWITLYSKYAASRDVNEVCHFQKKGKQLICESITVSEPRRYYGNCFWDEIAVSLKKDYEQTGFLDMPMKSPVYKSISGRFKIDHYVAMDFLSDDLISLNYYLDTSNFKAK
ncbi:hypothetical protein [Pedobacter nanyangensis]|uniref:hypothetical protein n=1 Tax=Pedobacter nanyangensis TaxID=1562389 RepID=UPI000DE57578|nr:hypothetical protein [Pedobacter nanyangensis]